MAVLISWVASHIDMAQTWHRLSTISLSAAVFMNMERDTLSSSYQRKAHNLGAIDF